MTAAPIPSKKSSATVLKRFAAMNMLDLPRDEDGQPIPKDSDYAGPVQYHLRAVTAEGEVQRHPCTPAVYTLLQEMRPDRNKKVDYLLGFKDGLVISVTGAARPNNLAGFSIDDPEAKGKSNVLILNVYEGGTNQVDHVPEKVQASTVEKITSAVMNGLSAGTLRAGHTVAEVYVVKEIRQLPGYSQVHVDTSARF